MPGDDLISPSGGSLTHAITLGATPRAVWSWLIQMGAGSRAGWYSYDALDNGGQSSATALEPSLQRITLGTLFPALPGVKDGFVVLAFEPRRFLVLGWPDHDGEPVVTWAFVLKALGKETRLIVRARGRADYRFRGLPRAVSTLVIRAVHFVMERRQLLGIARRVESTPGRGTQPATESMPVAAALVRARERRHRASGAGGND